MTQTPRRATVLALANQKGGVTKTTSTANLGMMLALAGLKVLVVDCDPQGHLTYTLGYTPDILEGTIYDALRERIPLQQAIRRTVFNVSTRKFLDLTDPSVKSVLETSSTQVIAGPDLAPLNIASSTAEAELRENSTWGLLLRLALRAARQYYDYILLDTNPSLGVLTVNALNAADDVCIPLVPEMLAVQGLKYLLGAIQESRKIANPELRIAGVVFTRVQNLRPHKEIVNGLRTSLQQQYQIHSFQTEIKQSVNFLNAANHRSVVAVDDPLGDQAFAYWSLLEEIVACTGGHGREQIQRVRTSLLHQREYQGSKSPSPSNETSANGKKTEERS
jgi:chromosome partitioning protein